MREFEGKYGEQPRFSMNNGSIEIVNEPMPTKMHLVHQSTIGFLVQKVKVI